MTVGLIICAVALILALWTLAFELNRVGDALWHMQADSQDIRCSINAIGEPAHKLLTAQVKEQTFSMSRLILDPSFCFGP